MYLSLPPENPGSHGTSTDTVRLTLRDELEANPPEALAFLLNAELAHQYEASREDRPAARHWLAAVNLNSSSKEALMRLLGLVQRRRSWNNLNRVSERLTQAGMSSSEQRRGWLLTLGLALWETQDADESENACRKLIALSPEDPLGWLCLELCAWRFELPALRREALSRLAANITEPATRGTLLYELATTPGVENLTVAAVVGQLVQVRHPLAYLLVEERTRQLFSSRIAILESRNKDGLAKANAELDKNLALECELLALGLDNAEHSKELGIPEALLNRSEIAERLRRRSELADEMGRSQLAEELIDAACKWLPASTELLRAKQALLEEHGEIDKVAQLAKEALAQRKDSPLSHQFHLLLAENAMAHGEFPQIIAALDDALAVAPESLLAWALKLDILSTRKQPMLHAAALEELSTILPTHAGQMRQFVRAAYIFAVEAAAPERSRQALLRAKNLGLDEDLRAALEWAFARVCEDRRWELELITRQAQEEGSLKAAAYLQLLKPEIPPPSRGFGVWLEAFPFETEQQTARLAQGVANSLQSDEAKLIWSLLCPSPEAKNISASNSSAETQSLLRGFEAQRLIRSNPKQAAKLLQEEADTCLNAQESAFYRLEAGLLLWHQDERSDALKLWNKIDQASLGDAALLLRWAKLADAGQNKLVLKDDEFPDDAFINGLRRWGNLSSSLRSTAQSSKDTPLSPVSQADFAQTEAKLTFQLLDIIDGKFPEGELTPELAPLKLSKAIKSKNHAARLQAATELFQLSPSAAAAFEWATAARLLGQPEEENLALKSLAETFLPGSSERKAIDELLATISVCEAVSNNQTTDISASALLNLEQYGPGNNPTQRAAALEGSSGYFEESERAQVLVLAAFNHLAAAELKAAQGCFRDALAEGAESWVCWDGLYAVGHASSDSILIAEAARELGLLCTDLRYAASLLEEAGKIYEQELYRPELAAQCFADACTKDLTLEYSFGKYFRALRQRKEHNSLIELIDKKLQTEDSSELLSKLFWEKARALRSLDRLAEAESALSELAILEPQHSGAMALRAELAISQEDYELAAQQLSLLAQSQQAPVEQRIVSAVAASDILENRLKRPGDSLPILRHLSEQGLGGLGILERLAKSALNCEHWELAAKTLEQLAQLRPNAEGQQQAAKLAWALSIDELEDSEGALRCAKLYFSHDDIDIGALDLVFESHTSEALQRQLYDLCRNNLRNLLPGLDFESGNFKDLLRRASQISHQMLDADSEQIYLGVLVSSGFAEESEKERLNALNDSAPKTPTRVLDDTIWDALSLTDDDIDIGNLFADFAAELHGAWGKKPTDFNLGRKNRWKEKAHLPFEEFLNHWLGALGLRRPTLYFSDDLARCFVAGVDGTEPFLVFSSKLQGVLSPFARQELVRELYALRRGINCLTERSEEDCAAALAALYRFGQKTAPGPALSMSPEFERLLTKNLSKKRAKELLNSIAQLPVLEPLFWARAMQSSQDRCALLAVADPSWILSKTSDSRKTSRTLLQRTEQLREQRLLSYALCEDYQRHRHQIGMSWK